MVLTKKAVEVMRDQVNPIKGVEIPLLRRAGIVLREEVGVDKEVGLENQILDKENWKGLEADLMTGGMHDLEVDPLAMRVQASIVEAEVDLWKEVVNAAEKMDMMGNIARVLRTVNPDVVTVICSTDPTCVIKRRKRWKQTQLKSKQLILMLW